MLNNAFFHGDLNEEVYMKLPHGLSVSRPSVSSAPLNFMRNCLLILFLKYPRVPHMSAVVHLLRYLKGTPDVGLFFSYSCDLTLTTYPDGDWVTCVDTRRSVTGFCTYRVVVHIKKDPIFHERTKYFEVDCHFIRTKLGDSLIQLAHVPIAKQLADIFTKPLAWQSHHRFLSKLQVVFPSNLREGIVGLGDYMASGLRHK
ncbi:PREDICTED: uncharacterized protein LOC109243036 [Nicotiana attenuata]|uniref:uncharacterized protein LOC109243036 n=1 Tax=Nicotiana attenuata TaxID=49451 RepID=UPI0009047917|nr:PREDICTED: uncharacterized protein LOC109243036 [Nicotiana attenuata]